MDVVDNMDSNYQEAYTDLENRLAKAKNDDEECEMLDTFASNQMMPWQLWKKLIRGTPYEDSEDDSDSGDDFVKLLSFFPLCFQQKNLRALQYLKKRSKEMNDFFRQVEECLCAYHCVNRDTIFPNCLKSLLAVLKYPHADIEQIWKVYRKNACSLPSKELEAKFMRMVALYEKMKNSEEEESYIFEAESEEYIHFNVVRKLADDLFNKKLWKLYINHLKSKTDKEFLLQTYSNYCRLFLSDEEMKKEYQEAVEKFGPSKVAWKNRFAFEEKKQEKIVKFLIQEKEHDDLDICEDAFDLKQPFPGIKFSFEGIIPQRFPFRPSLMRYIWDNANPRIRQKLYSTCKYFFAKHPYPICYKLALETTDENSSEEIVQQSLKVEYGEDNMDILKMENLWITDVLYAVNNVTLSETTSLAEYIPRIYRCDAKCVDIRRQVLTLVELQFLIGHGNVEDLILAYNFIINENDGNEVALEDIAKMVPKIKFFDVGSPILTPTTFSTMTNLPFKNKIHSVTLANIEKELEAQSVAKFITKNFASGSKIELYFKIKKNLVLNFKQILETAVNNHWKSEGNQPNLSIFQEGNDGFYSNV